MTGPRRPPRAARRRGLPAAAATATFVAFFLFALPGTASELDRVAAVVNGDVILVSEVERRFRHLVFDLRQTRSRLPTQEALVRRSLDELILERLQLGIAERLGLRVSDARVDHTIESIARRHNATLADLGRALEGGGIPFADFRERIRNDLIVEGVRRREVLNRIRVSNEEVVRYLSLPDRAPAEGEEYLVGHILISRAGGDTAARAAAEDVLRRLRAGESFAALARRHSSGARASEGGTLDWRPAAALPSLFADVVPDLAPGDTSDIIESSSGFHIVRLLDVRATGQSVVHQTHAAHILVTLKPLVSDDDARLRLERLRERILQGEDFGELARFHSDDTASAVRGGDLGWLSPGDAAPEFEAVVNAMEEGEVSEPFKSSFGWHLVRVLARRDHDNTEEVRRAQARNAVFQRKANEALTAWLGELRDNAFVRIRLGE